MNKWNICPTLSSINGIDRKGLLLRVPRMRVGGWGCFWGMIKVGIVGKVLTQQVINRWFAFCWVRTLLTVVKEKLF